MNDGRPPKKAHSRPLKTRVKPPPQKVMVKRETDHSGKKDDFQANVKEIESKKIYPRSIMFSRAEEEEDEEDEEEEEIEKVEDEEAEENDVDADEMEALEEDSEEDDEELEDEEEEKANKRFVRKRRSVKKYPRASAGQSPLAVDYAENYDSNKDKSLVKPLFSSIVYSLPVSISVKFVSVDIFSLH